MSTNEAAERLYSLFHAIRHDVKGYMSEAEMNATLDTALAHERSAGATLLDGERLAEAILRHDADDSWPSGSKVAHDRGKCWNGRCAQSIVAAYARLAEGTDR